MEKRKSKKRIGELIAFTTAIVIVLAIVFIPGLKPFETQVIITGSMEPEVEVGALALVNTRTDLDSLEVGDIISFHAEINSQLGRQQVLHYVHDITYDEAGNRIWTTIAAETETPDDWVVTDEDIIGQYLTHMNGVGRGVLFLQSGFGRLLLFGNIAFLVLISYAFKGKDKQSKTDQTAA